ncbi:MAG: hypothetical protein HC875_00990 [Anaerolineales bacterium]|nr:hypothetical protein [Anaerolineales bacterium]
MGQGGYVKLSNHTPYLWARVDQGVYQMEWNFPNEIPAHESRQAYVEFKTTLFSEVADDSAFVQYRLGDSGQPTFRIKAKVEIVFIPGPDGVDMRDYEYQLWVDWETTRDRRDLSLSPLPVSGDSPLGFIHDGVVELSVSA